MPVLYGTTLRPETEPLAELAARLAVRLRTVLRLVHASEDARAALLIGTDQEHLLGDVREKVEGLAARLAERTGAEVHPHLLPGPAVTALRALAELELARVLVVGDSGRRMRRVGERLSRETRVPVMILRDPERLRAPLSGERPLRVLVGADLGRTSRAARAFAASLAATGPHEVEVLLVLSPDDVRPEETALRELADAAPDGESASLRALSRAGRADAHLVARAAEGGFDVLVVGQRQHSLLAELWDGSVARGVLSASPVSVVTVPLGIGEIDVCFRPPRVVVAGVDMSELAPRVITHALGYAEARGTVHLAHVIDVAPSAEKAIRAREEAWFRLEKLAREIAGDRSLAIEMHILEGVPDEQLSALCDRVGADLLVLGGATAGSPSRRVFSSKTANALVERAKVPVLVVPASDV